MDEKDLRFFVAAYEAKGFSRASQSLGTVQSNVSARIRNLEQLLGVSLFKRHYRGIVPTAHGERLYADAKEILASLDWTENLLRSSRSA